MSDGNIQYSTMMENGVMVRLDEDSQLNGTLETEQADGSENVLVVGGDDDSDQVQQAIEITTEDGRRVTLIIPSNGNPCELAPEY